MRNVSLLEEVFLVNSSLEGPTTDMLSLPDTSTSDEGNARRAAILGSKVKQRSNPVRTDGIRERIQELVDQGLKNLQNWELDDEGGPASADDLNSQEPKRPKKIKNWRAEKLSAVSDIIEKLNKARNEDDLKSCLELKSQLFNQHDKASLSQSEDVETSKEKAAEDVSTTKTESDYSLPRLFYKVEVNEEAFNSMEAHFSSIDQIEDL
nr:TPA_asm: hypothetical protein HUJ06_017537 [Nelumbo nucifera]